MSDQIENLFAPFARGERRQPTAASRAQAPELAAEECPRVALLDIGLPDINGRSSPVDCASAARSGTGCGHEEARERSLAAGFDDHLAKSVDRRSNQALLRDGR